MEFKGWQWLRQTIIGVLFALELALLGTCSPATPQLERMRDLGVVRIGTINSPTTYYQSGDGPTGFEFDLSRQFARHLDLELDLRVYASPQAALDALARREIDLAAANLTVTEARSQRVLFSPAVRQLVPQLVYRRGSGRPRGLADVEDSIHVPARSAQLELLQQRAADHPQLRWTVRDEVSNEDLLAEVAAGLVRFSVADSDIVAMTQRYFPQLAVAMELGEPARKAWAFRRSADTSLFNRAAEFLTVLMDNGELARLNDRYFGHVDRLDFVSSRSLSKHVDTRLPKYQELFRQAGAEVGVDWRLLAAISYQESHWNPRAVSPTGVRGLMMLTRDTADYVGVKNRLDPAESIAGGARYFRFLLDRLPDDIHLPDRIWLTLAAYNLGYGHVLDLRELTEQRGGDPNRWVDLRSNLRLLTQEAWYSQTRYGYARGHEAEVYVGNVRTYLDVLRWMTLQDEPESTGPLAKPRTRPPPEPPPPSALDLELPVL